ncbi:MAG: TetR/AcrR family transcriptional regulator [Luteibacter sp.]
MMSTVAPNNTLETAATPSVRDQIIDAADEYFSRYGYAKTTVSDLAKAIGFSKAYIYKFFDSKQAIGEAICARCLTGQFEAVVAAVDAAKGPNERLRAYFKAIVEQSTQQFFAERQLYDIVVHSCSERWASSEAFVASLMELLVTLVQEGRDAGAFERKTPLDEVTRGIWFASLPFTHPVMLQHNLDDVESGLAEVTSLILRSLAP